MKRILLYLLAMTMLSCVAANAQSSIRYLPSTGSGNTYQQPQEPQEQYYSTTAYYETNDGYVKMPIRVAVDGRGNIRVVSYYQQTLIGGEWKNVLGVNHAERCRASSYGSNLERQFMFKCYIMAFGGVTIYFDL